MFLSLDTHPKNAHAAIDKAGATLTYGELQDEATAFARYAGGGRLLFSLCKNALGALSGYIGCLENNVVPLLLDAGIDAQLLGNLMETYHPSYLWLPEELVGRFKWHPTYSSRGFCLLQTDYEPYPLHPDLALLISTSGSTGSPKLVRQSHENLKSNATSIASYLHICAAQRPITSLPMPYVYGLSIINSHLLKGSTLLMTEDSLMQKDFWRFFNTQGATSIAGVPYTYEMLKRLNIFDMNLPSLQTLTQAGGKLMPELHREYAEWTKATGREFVVMYGAAEATARMGYLPAERSIEKYGSIGIAIPGGRFWLADADGKVIEQTDTVGELMYEGDNVTLGYAERGEDLAKGDERGGVLQTGDMAKRDADGFYTVVGRKKRFLKMFGNRVGLDEVELMIKREFDVGCACVGTDDHMVIYITGDDTSAVRTFIAEKTGIHASAFAVRHTDEIPKNEAGKTLYSKLEEF